MDDINVVKNKNSTGHYQDDELLSIAECECIADVVNMEYQEIIRLCGLEVACKLFRHFRGCRIDFPKYFYKVDYIIEVAAKKHDRRERERVAIIAGYTAQWLEKQIRERNNCCPEQED